MDEQASLTAKNPVLLGKAPFQARLPAMKTGDLLRNPARACERPRRGNTRHQPGKARLCRLNHALFQSLFHFCFPLKIRTKFDALTARSGRLPFAARTLESPAQQSRFIYDAFTVSRYNKQHYPLSIVERGSSSPTISCHWFNKFWRMERPAGLGLRQSSGAMQSWRSCARRSPASQCLILRISPEATCNGLLLAACN